MSDDDMRNRRYLLCMEARRSRRQVLLATGNGHKPHGKYRKQSPC